MTTVSCLALAAILIAGGCESCGCGEDDTIAQLKSRDGDVRRDTLEAPEDWKPAEVGARFRFEEAVRTGAEGTASVELVGGAALRVEPDTIIRFLPGVPDQQTPGIDVETGEAIVEAGDAEIAMRTGDGVATIGAGGRLRMTAGEDGVRYEVLIGQAEIEHGDQQATLEEGESLDLDPEGELVAAADEATDAEADAGAEASADAGGPQDDTIVVEVRGRGVRARAPDVRRWQRLDEGSTTAVAGTRLRIPRGASVAVRRGGASGTLSGAGEFVLGEEQSMVRAESGSLEMSSGGSDVTVVVPGGTIVVRGGGSSGEAEVRGRRGTEVRALRGTLSVQGEDGEEQVLEVGESASLRPGGALDNGLVAPDRPTFVAPAGTSFTVRDARPPTAVGLRIGTVCSGPGVAELLGRASHASHGTGIAPLAVPGGSHRYQVRCVGADGTAGDVVAEGTIRVLRDPGRTLRPRRPPASVVDTDGRRYTVLYQTLLPEITVRWPRAPEDASSFRLKVISRGQTRTLSTSGPRHRFESGELGEGVHELVFEGGGERSRATTLAIGFDNAAPTASVSSPADGSFSPGDTVSVQGIALEGWSVSVGDRDVPLDAQRRFDTEMTVPSNQDGIAIRLSHPSRGVHYYVRHGND